MMTHEAFLKIENVVVTFSRWGQSVIALDNVSLEIYKGQWVVLTGPNGSGKTTLLRAISKRLTPERGEVLIAARSVRRMTPRILAQNVFHVHQDPLLGTAPILTIFENLAVADPAVQLDHLSRHQQSLKYRELLRPFGLDGRMRQPVQTLSGGERQLLTLLIARLRPAELILLDEPLAALDPARAEVCLAAIKALHEQGKTLLQVTHDVNLATELGERTVALHAGRVVYDRSGRDRIPDELHRYWYSGIDRDNR